jgi:hypothetical protein
MLGTAMVTESIIMNTKAVVATALLLCTNAQAATITDASAVADLTAQIVHFQIVYDTAPDFFTVDSAGRPKDQFAYAFFDLGRGPDPLKF